MRNERRAMSVTPELRIGMAQSAIHNASFANSRLSEAHA